MGSTKIKRILNQDISGTTKPKLRVCAYCRVSSKSEEQLTSYETQVAVYTEKISSEPGWEFVGIYADRGTSATMMARRKEFLRMLEDCEKGLIDCVICKSLSRFARNTLDALNCIKKLRDLGVRLILEKEGIDTDMISSEILLSVFAAFGKHIRTTKELIALEVKGTPDPDDRSMKVFWKCGLVTTVPSDVFYDSDLPGRVAKRYHDQQKRKAEKNKTNKGKGRDKK